VPANRQRELARALRAPAWEVAGSHLAVSTHADELNRALLEALEAVVAPRPLSPAGAGGDRTSPPPTGTRGGP
jgi:hypothetical protein